MTAINAMIRCVLYPLSYRRIVAFFCLGLCLLTVPFAIADETNSNKKVTFKSIPTQYIAALAEPDASSGTNAQTWGLWPVDPGPRGVRLNQFSQLQKNSGIAPSNWKFDNNSWWLEEHGLIMEAPVFPLASGKYIVTGGRAVTTVLTVYPADSEGNQRWELEEGTLYDVTHLACRSAVYTPIGNNSCTPEQAKQSDFPVRPGAEMPSVKGCDKQDYAVLIVVAVEDK